MIICLSHKDITENYVNQFTFVGNALICVLYVYSYFFSLITDFEGRAMCHLPNLLTCRVVIFHYIIRTLLVFCFPDRKKITLSCLFSDLKAGLMPGAQAAPRLPGGKRV